MIQINNNLLEEIGLGSLPEPDKRSLLNHIYETLELRVGMRLAEQMSNEQLDEFERYFQAKDEQGAFRWLETNFPNYKDIVQQEFEKLKSEVAQSAPQILSASQQQPGGLPGQPGQPPMPPQMPPQQQPQAPMPGVSPAPGPGSGQGMPAMPAQQMPAQPQPYQQPPQQQPGGLPGQPGQSPMPPQMPPQQPPYPQNPPMPPQPPAGPGSMPGPQQ